MARRRARELGIAPGVYEPGPLNGITDVAGVAVGQVTLIEGDGVRTGVTAVLPHEGNLYQQRVPAALAVANGYGKLMGATQLQELGELETPILLTNTLSVPRAADALITWTLAQEGNEAVRSVNPIVGETNDGWLNDIRRRALSEDHFLRALAAAESGKPVDEGSVGAGTGTVCCGWKGGVGTSSRRLPIANGGFMLGVLVQANYGGNLQIMGLPVGQDSRQETGTPLDLEGSIMIILATDAPLSDRNLKRLAWRSFAGLARTGSNFSNGSGDYAVAFSTALSVRRRLPKNPELLGISDYPNARLSPLFQAASEATEEAIYNALFMATTITGYERRTVEALPLSQVRALLGKRLAG